MVFNVHEFQTEAEAVAAMATINAGEGYPIPGCITTDYASYFLHGGLFVMYADDVTKKYFTEVIQIEIKRNEFL